MVIKIMKYSYGDVLKCIKYNDRIGLTNDYYIFLGTHYDNDNYINVFDMKTSKELINVNSSRFIVLNAEPNVKYLDNNLFTI